MDYSAWHCVPFRQHETLHSATVSPPGCISHHWKGFVLPAWNCFCPVGPREKFCERICFFGSSWVFQVMSCHLLSSSCGALALCIGLTKGKRNVCGLHTKLLWACSRFHIASRQPPGPSIRMRVNKYQLCSITIFLITCQICTSYSLILPWAYVMWIDFTICQYKLCSGGIKAAPPFFTLELWGSSKAEEWSRWQWHMPRFYPPFPCPTHLMRFLGLYLV